MIGRRAEAVLNRSVRFAIEHEHEYFTLEHVLWSLMEEPDVAEAVRACNGDPARLRADLEAHLHREIPKAPKNPDGADHPVATLSIQRLIQRALFHVQSAGKDEIRPLDLLVAFFQCKDSHALFLLNQQGIERLDALNWISHGVRKDTDRPVDGEPPEDIDAGSDFDPASHRSAGSAGSPGGGANPGGGNGPAAGAGSGDPLKLYTVNLNERARAGKIDPLIGRQNELERMLQTLCRRRKNNPLLVGEAGVGKTALAEGLAARIINDEVPSILENAVVYSLDLGSLLAGAKFRGDFEQRLKRVLSALQAKRDRGLQPILFIDEIHTLIGAGAVSGSVLDAANLLKPLLAQGELKCIGSTTYAEYRNVFEKDHALARRFQKIDVVEPSPEEAIQILTGLKGKFEEHHGVKYTNDAIRSAVELSAKHLTDRFLPDKAIDVMDEVGAKSRLAKSNIVPAPGPVPTGDPIAGLKASAGATGDSAADAAPAAPSNTAPTVIDTADIEEIIAQIARIPARSVSTTQKSRLKNLERDLKLTIFGQDHAIDAIVNSIRLARSGLRNGDKPVGSFLFCGPTGVGKTELSKQLAHNLGVPFLRFDMSEYSEKHTVSRLIGAPPGYVGFEQAGLLTDAILKNPHAVVLLDEIEKGHAEIWNILLQVMDHGVLTDNNGRKADFRNAILLMTSNVGSREMERRPIGFAPAAVGENGTVAPNGAMNATASASQRAVEQTFSPEFRNRLDAIVYFNALGPVTVGQVVGKQLVELESQLLAKGVEIELDPDVREWLAQKGYDRNMGARPMARLIQDKIKKPLAEEILFGRLENGGHVQVRLKNGEPDFTFTEKAGAASTASAPAARENDHAP